MSSAVTTAACPGRDSAAVPLRRMVIARATDYAVLAKPRIAVLALAAVTVGFILGSAGRWDAATLLAGLVGIGLVAAASSAFNQLLERGSDGRMQRTSDRPLPAERLTPAEAAAFAVLSSAAGLACLAVLVNPLTAWLALVTLVLYAGIYTPLKRYTSLCTAVGAVPGALPPVLGWTAAGGELNSQAFALFAILYLWQFPHFLAIGWLYREEYTRARLKMLPACGSAGLLALGYSLALLPVSLLPREWGLVGDGYVLAAVMLGGGYVLAAARFCWHETYHTARGLLWSSLAYLPVLLFALTWNHLQLLR